MTTAIETKLTRTQAEVIVKLANNNMNVRAAAREMFMHYNTVHYHVRMIERNTGKSPLLFYELNELLSAAKEVLKQEDIAL